MSLGRVGFKELHWTRLDTHRLIPQQKIRQVAKDFQFWPAAKPVLYKSTEHYKVEYNLTNNIWEYCLFTLSKDHNGQHIQENCRPWPTMPICMINCKSGAYYITENIYSTTVNCCSFCFLFVSNCGWSCCIASYCELLRVTASNRLCKLMHRQKQQRSRSFETVFGPLES